MFSDETSNGMQFPPFQSTTNDLKVFDARLIQVFDYSHTSDNKVGSSDLVVNQFDTQWGITNDVGFAFDQDLYE
jgi:hypothetical protein